MRIFTISVVMVGLLLALTAPAQQLTIDPGVGETFTPVQTDTISPGEYVAIGSANHQIILFGNPAYVDGAVVVRYNDSAILWAKVFGFGTVLTDLTVCPNGDILVVGSLNSDAMVSRFDPAGNVVWSNAYNAGLTQAFTSIAVAPDGFIYPSGTRIAGGVPLVIALRLDASGNPLWEVQQPGTLTSNSVTKSFVRGDSLFLFGTATSGMQQDVALRILNTQTSLEIFHRTYGDNTTGDWVADVAWIPGGLLVATTQSAGPSSRMGLFKLDVNLNLSGNSKSYLVPGAQVARASISLCGGEAYMSSQVASGPNTYSHLLKIDIATLDTLWSKTLVNSAFPMKPIVESGIVRVMNTKSDTPPNPVMYGVLTGLNSIDGSFVGTPCEIPTQQNFIKQNYSNLAQQPYTPAVWTTVSVTIVASLIVSDYTLYLNVCENAPLPIELISFTAKANGRNVLLEWATASERNNDFFTVERSTDGGATFEPILRQDGYGDSQTIQRYSDIDENPATGTNYYRLRQTDLDGTTTVSSIEVVDFQASAEIIAYPNPASAGEEIRFRGSFEVFDMTGRFVTSAIDRVSLESGVYMFRALAGSARVVVQ